MKHGAFNMTLKLSVKVLDGSRRNSTKTEKFGFQKYKIK